MSGATAHSVAHRKRHACKEKSRPVSGLLHRRSTAALPTPPKSDASDGRDGAVGTRGLSIALLVDLGKRLYVDQHSLMDCMNDRVGPKPPVRGGPHLVRV